ncbi:holo-ACP synthase [Roseomonas frigidaquae]|uniref:Holo-[acyl-carrier-protein] synthase n=1 Tax=Falsiroseomonas frigidaquae TaxID=487318 RepID=A0ABX1F8E6_9PROT|nr:holo-ACP synthase [Falsiroseomonas frigidaquae]NKE48578.1 holo-ACP synthase [Falsiroseomonas frigidaquae]
MSVLIGLGLDLIDLTHFRVHYGDEDPELLARCFTEREIETAGTGADRLARLAARFAVKEATFKALGGGEGVGLPEIETVAGEDGVPVVVLHGSAKELAHARGVTSFLVSLTHSATSAAAVVIALSGGPR